MHETHKQIIILAAGKGSRMNSELPKVMHKVAGKSMLERVVENSSVITKDLILVYSDHIREFLPLFAPKCQMAFQERQLGTAHAVSVALPNVNPEACCAVIYGDNPLITPTIISQLFEHLESSKAAVITLAFEHNEPNAYGKIVLDENGNFKKIVEAKFATPEEQKITLCNSGIMVFAPRVLTKYIPVCLQNLDKTTSELYLTEIIEICVNAGEKVDYYTPDDSHLVIGVNTQEELAVANRLISS